MSELTREEIEALEPINAQLGELAWPYGVGRVLRTTALAYLDRAEEAERKHEYTLLEEAAQRNRAERAEANTTPALQVTVKSLQAHIEQLREKLSDADQRAERAEADLVVSKDVLRELVEANRAVDVAVTSRGEEWVGRTVDARKRFDAAIARAQDALNT